MIHIYECDTAPPQRRFIAQFERIKNNLYTTFQGSTAEKAQAKAELFLSYVNAEPKDRTGFKLREKLLAIEDGIADDDPPEDATEDAKPSRDDDLI